MVDHVDNALGSLQTEALNPDTTEIDMVSTEAMCRIMNQQDTTVPIAVERCIPKISRIIDLIVDRMRKGGRVVYIGAGTSGRLGVLDASEIPPTFSAPSSQFIGIIAGGDSALRNSIEGAEDSSTLPIEALSAISPPLTPLDTLIGIASSGRTPYVLAGMKHAKDHLGMLTVGLACVDRSEMRMKGCCGLKETGDGADGINDEDCAIECVVGPEVVAGSTRMKAGTATKLILNMISTGVMIEMGKTYGNLMIDVKASNHKLSDRARRIFQAVVKPTAHKQFTPTEIDDLIKSCGGSVKTAIVVANLNCSVEHAQMLLKQAEGLLKKVLLSHSAQHEEDGSQNSGDGYRISNPGLVLCIDAGGSRCKAVIASKDGMISRSEGGPCNFVTLGHDQALRALFATVTSALRLLPTNLLPSDPIRPGGSMVLNYSIFQAAWIGGAGLDRAADLVDVKRRIEDMLNLSSAEGQSKLFITNDAALLAPAILPSHTTAYQVPRNPLGISAQRKMGIVLIAGTGSLAYAFEMSDTSIMPIPIGRTSGWGYLLGDECSAFAIGREAIQYVLKARDSHPGQGVSIPFTAQPEGGPGAFTQEIIGHLGCENVGEVISAVYDSEWVGRKKNAAAAAGLGLGDRGSQVAGMDSPAAGLDSPKLRVASLAPIVLKYAWGFESRNVDLEALGIVLKAAESGVDVIWPLIQTMQPKSNHGIGQDGAPGVVLVLGGALMQVAEFRECFLKALKVREVQLERVEVVEDPARCAVEYLVREVM